MDIFGAVDLLSNLSAPPCAVIRIVDQVDHGEAPILIPKRGDPGVREGVADDHRGESGLLNLRIEEGVRHQLYAEQIGFTGHQERPPMVPSLSSISRMAVSSPSNCSNSSMLAQPPWMFM